MNSDLAHAVLFETPRTRVVSLTQQYAEMLHSYYTNNQEHLAEWEPERPADYHTVDSWRQRGREFQREHEAGVSLRLLALRPDLQTIVGVCFFTNISRGAFQACNLGYSISHEQGGKGLMTEIVGASIDYLFQTQDLHRVMANYVPENTKSARVLAKLGFEKEGYAKSYLRIAGVWRDHVLTAKLNPRHTTSDSQG